MPGKQPVSVLVVDDDGDVREAIGLLLQDAGYSVAEASNGAEALEMLESLTPDLILLDLSMPVMSGQQFRAVQLTDPEVASIPTIVMTATDRAREKTAAMHVHETLLKPLKMQQLLDCVAKHSRVSV